ncbi:OLC1v1004254C1 [Oldenlandia corymbosa var. corymbosa]|uniref:OLC1v1004254C1 n=1 Tax=Oldenlandia corymbosa var. corymbosa TaxID=529605 RepID=A0AAV1DCM6_OLDCO|nr:OLC1v1004254C1 [Oldenlandia corymbosa var. corymbosa]
MVDNIELGGGTPFKYYHHNSTNSSSSVSGANIASSTAAGGGGSGGGGSGDDGITPIKEQDRLLPIANVGRIMKQILPPNAKISKEAKETMQECASEFISFVTGEASDKCHKEKRKTVNGDDICWALGSLGFDEYAEPLKRYLNKFRELEGEKAAANQNKNGAATNNHLHHHEDNHHHHHQIIRERDNIEDESNFNTRSRGHLEPAAAAAQTPIKFNLLG